MDQPLQSVPTLQRRFKKLIFLLCPLLLLPLLITVIYDGRGSGTPPRLLALRFGGSTGVDVVSGDGQASLGFPVDANEADESSASDIDDEVKPRPSDGEDDGGLTESSIPDRGDYRELFSLTTRSREYFLIFWDGKPAYNPNLIAHPTKHNMWIVVAQHETTGQLTTASEEMVCNANFLGDALLCDVAPTILPVTETIQGHCEGKFDYLSLASGPHDARMFYGPDAPYVMYGAQSSFGCFGLWFHDARMLLDSFRLESGLIKDFRDAVEIQRPSPSSPMQKNFFVFWDPEGKIYAHHDIWPTRVFAEMAPDGSVGDDLGPVAATNDQVCMAKYMPIPAPESEALHQGTNSLSITLCERSDPKCIPNDSNTFIMHIFQKKIYYDYHAEYDPYVILFKRSAPFAIHAISRRPIWIHGRTALTALTDAVQYRGKEDKIPPNHTEMFYVTSISWKTHGQRYHGHIDDPLFLSFGIEDSRSAAIDVLAGDLVQDLGLC